MKQYIYTNKKDNRTRCYIVDDDGSRHTKSYPRMIMEEKLGRALEPNEDVHHIDGDPTNNNPENLEIILHGEHQRQHVEQKYFDTIMTCEICGKEFLMSAKRVSNYHRDLRIGRHRGITCSKRCAYLFGKQSS